MKSISEIQTLLASRIAEHLDEISLKVNEDYWNNAFPDSSYIIAALLQQLLKRDFPDWRNSGNWIDDCLATMVKSNNRIVQIWGVMIWGKEGTLKQWTDPFYFEFAFNKQLDNFESYTFLFADLNNPELIYEEFKKNRGYWDKNHYSSSDWNTNERKWKYLISY